MKKKYLYPWIGLYLASSLSYATPYGINISYLVLDKDPQYLHGYRASFLYQPPAWIWQHLQIFIDTSAGHWYVTNNTPYRNLNIYSIAPVFRFNIKEYQYITPFIDLSIGLAYLTKTHIDHQNLGIHFAFQDQLGIGFSFGQQKQWSTSLNALHYSNGSLCSKNAGITVPIMFNLSYHF